MPTGPTAPPRHLPARGAALACLAAACAAASAGAPSARDVQTLVHVDRVADVSTPARLAGARCADGACRCRVPGTDDAEVAPPEAGMKRYEIRLAADHGSAAVASPAFGRLAAATETDTCYYVDLLAGASHDVAFAVRAARSRGGFGARFRVAEYGVKQAVWYDIFAVVCGGAADGCRRESVDAWAKGLQAQRRRGRLDPCGSTVVTGLRWDTTGGEHDRDGGYYRDLTVGFALDVKKFTPQLAPGDPTCAPQ